MKFVHLSDLHIGKKVCGFSMIEDQAYILDQIEEIIRQKKPDGIFLAGDIYDKQIPSVEAVELFDRFLTEIAEMDIPIFIIAGNHDSAERLAFGAKLLEKHNIYIAGTFQQPPSSIVYHDAYGQVAIYLLPFIKPSDVRNWQTLENQSQETLVSTYHEAVKTVLEHISMDKNCRNVLLCHQFVTGAKVCDSEEVSVGGLDNIGSDLFDAFDYVALGHIHSPQYMGRETIRYSGTPLKYSFSEGGQEKSLTMVHLLEKGRVEIETIPLEPLHDMRKIVGPFAELIKEEHYMLADRQDYIKVVLTDEMEIADAYARLRSIYPRLMQIEYQTKRTILQQLAQEDLQQTQWDPYHMFSELYVLHNGREMSSEQAEYMENLINKLSEETQ